MRADVHRHLDDVGNKAFVLPIDDRSEFEVVLIRSERSGVTFFYGHAEIDDTHGLFPSCG